MSNKIVYEIKDNFEIFKELFENKKTINDNKILLVEKPSNKDWAIGNSKTSIEVDNTDDLEFIVEQKKFEKKYGLKFRAQKFCSIPFFRFDSDGPAHRNYDENIPLNQQKITTPHFNTFNNEGIAIAYKNDVLLDNEKAKVIVEDINFGVSLFCQESNARTLKDGFPEVFIKDSLLEYDYEEMINFDNLNFE